MHAVESRIAFAQIGVVGEAVSRGLPAEAGAEDGADWLRGLVPITPGQAFARASLAEALRQPGELTRSATNSPPERSGPATSASLCAPWTPWNTNPNRSMRSPAAKSKTSS